MISLHLPGRGAIPVLGFSKGFSKGYPIKSPISDLVQLLFPKGGETKAHGAHMCVCVCLLPEVTQQNRSQAMSSPARLGVSPRALVVSRAKWPLCFPAPCQVSACPQTKKPSPGRWKGRERRCSRLTYRTKDAGQGSVPAVRTTQLLPG